MSIADDATSNLTRRGIPARVRPTLAAGPGSRHQSLNAYLIDVLTREADTPTMSEVLADVEAIRRPTGLTGDDAVAAVREARQAPRQRMGLTVVDASVIVDLLAADDAHRRTAARQRLTSGDAVFAPAYLDIEIVSAMRGLARRSPSSPPTRRRSSRWRCGCRSAASPLLVPPRTGSGSCGRT